MKFLQFLKQMVDSFLLINAVLTHIVVGIVLSFEKLLDHSAYA